jgi:putative two-component system response regulator
MDERWKFFRRWSASPPVLRVDGPDGWKDVVGETQLYMRTVLDLALELKDPTDLVAAHCTRVAALSTSIAEALGIGEQDRDLLRRAAQLHEIGIVGLPVDLLQRADPLAEEELEQVRAHAKLGAEIVRASHGDRVAQLVLYQYADYQQMQEMRLSADDLLLAGILRVADVVDAVTVPRAYQNPLPGDERREVLRRGIGSKFHPVAVHSLLMLDAGC